MSRDIFGEGCGYLCKHRHDEEIGGIIPTCEAFPDGDFKGCNGIRFLMRECANGVGFEPNERCSAGLLALWRNGNPWLACQRHYLQFGTPRECWRCHSDTIQVYCDVPLTTRVTFVCYGCGERYTFDSDKTQYLNKRLLRYIGHNLLFPLTFGKIYECDWMEYGMYWIKDDKNEEYLYPLYVFEIV